VAYSGLINRCTQPDTFFNTHPGNIPKKTIYLVHFIISVNDNTVC
jgi:hypothetical protein